MHLDITHLSFRYTRQSPWLFDQFDLSVSAGQTLAVLGNSGSGKSTLLRIIAGLETRSQGEIRIGSTICQNQTVFLPAEKRRVGFVFQDYALFPFLTVIENIRFGMKKPDKPAVHKLMEMTQLVGLEHRYPHELSGGQQQRTALARSLAAKPGILLLDEPFSNLDAGLVAEMRLDLKRILKQQQMTSILVTHDEADAVVMADQVLHLS